MIKAIMAARQEKVNREVAVLLSRIEYKNENPEFVQKMLFGKDYKI